MEAQRWIKSLLRPFLPPMVLKDIIYSGWHLIPCYSMLLCDREKKKNIMIALFFSFFALKGRYFCSAQQKRHFGQCQIQPIWIQWWKFAIKDGERWLIGIQLYKRKDMEIHKEEIPISCSRFRTRLLARNHYSKKYLSHLKVWSHFSVAFESNNI